MNIEFTVSYKNINGDNVDSAGCFPSDKLDSPAEDFTYRVMLHKMLDEYLENMGHHPDPDPFSSQFIVKVCGDH